MEAETYLRFVLALVFVLALIGLMAWLARRMGFGIPLQGGRGQKKTRRLGLVEVMPLDGRRRLVLVRRDDVEHLVILGPNSETVVETDVPPGGGDGSFRASLASAGRRGGDAGTSDDGDSR